jgi:phosphoglycolate phosphatase-like HAD superfamily hydrolase
MKPYEAYLLDFDGTLFNTYQSLVGVYQYSFGKIGEVCTPEQTAFYMHMSLSECCDYRGLSDPAKRAALFAAIYASLDFPRFLDEIRIFPDVKPLLEGLKAENKILAVVSGNTPKHISLILNKFGLASYFSVIVGADPNRRPKPFADPILAALREIPSLRKDQVVYIGDSLQDPETAKNAGVAGVLIERNHEYPDYPDPKITTLTELLE